MNEQFHIIKDSERGVNTIVVTKAGDCETARRCDRDRVALQLLKDLKAEYPDESLVYQLIVQICPRLAAISVEKYKATGRRQGKDYLIDGHVNTRALPYDIFTSSSSSGSTASGSPQTPASTASSTDDLNLEDHLDEQIGGLAAGVQETQLFYFDDTQAFKCPDCAAKNDLLAEKNTELDSLRIDLDASKTREFGSQSIIIGLQKDLIDAKRELETA